MEPTQNNSDIPVTVEPIKEEQTFINIDDYAKVPITVGEILSAEMMPKSDKLLILKVNFGEATPRQICSGIAKYYPDPQVLVGKKVAFCTNLESRMLRGYESQGMILAASTEETFSLLEISPDVPAGTKVK
jgi:methionyl-tRNA synthetase